MLLHVLEAGCLSLDKMVLKRSSCGCFCPPEDKPFSSNRPTSEGKGPSNSLSSWPMSRVSPANIEPSKLSVHIINLRWMWWSWKVLILPDGLFGKSQKKKENMTY